jgi:hypothetical protein
MQSCKEYLYIFAAENAFYLLPCTTLRDDVKVWIVEW